MSGPRIPRTGRGLTAVVVALVVAAAATTAAIDIISTRVQHRTLVWNQHTLTTHLRGTSWSNTSVTITAAVVITVGALLLLGALLPGRAKLIALHEEDPQLAIGTSRRSLRGTLTERAAGVDGVSAARIHIRRRTVRVKAHTPLRHPGDLADRIRDSVIDRLDDLHPAQPLTVRVDLRRKEKLRCTLAPAGATATDWH